jgi:hypothetical protein
VEIVHPTLFPFSKEPKYKEVDYTTGGARKKDSQRPELFVDRAPQERHQQVPPFRRQETQTEEQWETIQSVKQTIGTGPSRHQYEVPKFPQHLERSPQHQDYDQRRRTRHHEEVDADGDRRTYHKDLRVLRVEPPLLHIRDGEGVRERVKSKGHLFGPSSTLTPQRSEARALTPDFGSHQSSGNWEKEMMRNINQISITGGLTKLQSESFLLQKQDEKRVEIQHQLANIQTLNNSINLEVGSNHGSLEDDQEIDDLQHIICSTDPGLLDNNYATRLEIMRSVQENLSKALVRKSQRLQKVQDEHINTQGLPKREKQNLQY